MMLQSKQSLNVKKKNKFLKNVNKMASYFGARQ